MALGCIDKLIGSGLRVPDDISVMGYDDIPFACMFRPRLSTVHSPIREFGIEAVKAMLHIIYSKKDRQQGKIFDPELIIRDSTSNSQSAGR